MAPAIALKPSGVVIAMLLLSVSLSGCQKEPVKLLCSPLTQWADKVAIELDEEKSTAKLLDPISLLSVNPNPIVDTFFSPTVVHMKEADTRNFWMLDRSSGKLDRANPRTEYYCSSGRRF